MKKIIFLLSLLFSAVTYADVTTRILDTGAGLATITRFPNGDIMIYDTGHWDHDPKNFAAFKSFIGDNAG